MEIIVKRFPDREKLSRDAAEVVSATLIKNVEEKGRGTIVLSGGNTPCLLYEYLSEDMYASKIPWEKIHLFWGDERYVPINHSENNYNTVHTLFISKLSIPSSNIHRIKTELTPPEKAALGYEKELKELFEISGREGAGELPEFDIVLLGIGNDGHTASLFPGGRELDVKERMICAVTAPEQYEQKERITMTLPLINNASKIMFLVSGPGKSSVVARILNNRDTSADMYPAARVRARNELTWYLTS